MQSVQNARLALPAASSADVPEILRRNATQLQRLSDSAEAFCTECGWPVDTFFDAISLKRVTVPLCLLCCEMIASILERPRLMEAHGQWVRDQIVKRAQINGEIF